MCGDCLCEPEASRGSSIDGRVKRHNCRCGRPPAVSARGARPPTSLGVTPTTCPAGFVTVKVARRDLPGKMADDDLVCPPPVSARDQPTRGLALCAFSDLDEVFSSVSSISPWRDQRPPRESAGRSFTASLRRARACHSSELPLRVTSWSGVSSSRPCFSRIRSSRRAPRRGPVNVSVHSHVRRFK
jgi:hypothetical protein